jgi:glycosyltransferase involved in cell wall biosynthesis
MNIGFDAKRAFLNQTGLGFYSRNLISAVQELSSHSIVLFTTRVKISFPISKSTKVITPPSMLPRFLGSIWRSFLITFQKEVRKTDIYHGLSGELPFFLSNSVKKVVTIHDILFERFPEDYPYLDRCFARLKTKYACRTSDIIIAISEGTKQDLIKWYGVHSEKIVVVSVPVTISSKVEILEIHSRPFIVMVASFQSRKNQILLIKAFEAIADLVDFDLILIGNGTEALTSCKDYVKNSKVKPRVLFRETVSNDELPSYYKQAIFSVYASLYEGFGIPIIESIGYGCPILASDNMVHQEVGGTAAVYFKNGSLQDLKDKILEIRLNIEEHRSKVLKIQNSIMEKYSPSHIGRQVIAIYDSLS